MRDIDFYRSQRRSLLRRESFYRRRTGFRVTVVASVVALTATGTIAHAIVWIMGVV